MASREVTTAGLLWRKELRELLASRSYVLLLLIVSALVGHAFVTAVDTYAELSGAGGGPSALAQGMNPLDGVLVPTFGAYDLAATLLLPFVVIRLVAAERASGAWTILVQSPASVRLMVAVKAAALLAAWLIALLPGLAAVLFWRSYGGHVGGAELSGLLLGHLLRAGLTIGLAAAAAAVVEQSAGAAVVTLGVTVGSWALDFVAAARGGAVARLAAYTPTASLRVFEHGLLRANVMAVMTAATLAGLLIAAAWLDTGAAPSRRVRRSVFIAFAFAAVAAAGARLPWSWDVSEDRRHSFAREDAAALRRLPGTLRVETRLAPEDPRLVDLRQSVLERLDRVVPRLDVVDSSRSRTGLFARPDEHYGEVWYEIGGKRRMERSTIERVVLETVYGLTGVAPPAAGREAAYPGYPLTARPALAAPAFYLLWPALILVSFWLARRAAPAVVREAVTRRSGAPG